MSPAAAGSAMLQCTALAGFAASAGPAKSGQISRTLSHNVITRSNRMRANCRRCFVVLPLMSIPRSAITRTALACNGLGWLPALRDSMVCPERYGEQRLGHLRAGAVARAQEQDPRAAPPAA